MKFYEKKVSAALFDMDGTMFDTERLRVDMIRQASKEIAGIVVSDEVFNDSFGLNFKAAEGVAKNSYGEDYPYKEIRESADQLELKNIKENGMPVKEGLKELLENLKNNNIPIAMATSSKRSIAEKYVEIAGVKKYFDAIVCGDEVTKSKPNPEIFLKAAKKLKVKPSECLVFEDSDNGLISGSKAGMLPIFIKDIKTPDKEVLDKKFKGYESMVDFNKDFEPFLKKKIMPNIKEPFPKNTSPIKVGIHGFGAIGGGYWAQVFSHWDGKTKPQEIIGATADPEAKDLINAKGNYNVRYDKPDVDQKIDNVKAIDINKIDEMKKLYKESDLVAICLPEVAIKSQSKVIAKGLVERFKDKPNANIDIMFVLNKVDGEKFIKENVKDALKEIVGEKKSNEIMSKATFTETVVNRMVSNVSKKDIYSEIRKQFENKIDDLVKNRMENPKYILKVLPKVKDKLLENPKNSKLPEIELNRKAKVSLKHYFRLEGYKQVDKVMCEMPLLLDSLKKSKEVGFTLFNSEDNMPLIAKKGSPLVEKLRQVETVSNIHSVEVMKNRLSNGPHAVVAWYSALLGHKTIGQGMQDDRVVEVAKKAMEHEIKPTLKKDLKDVDDKMLDNFISEFIERCKDSKSDPCFRVGQDPLRKLASGERVLGSIQMAQKHNIDTKNLEFGMAVGILYAVKGVNSNDKESKVIKDIYNKNKSIKDVLAYTGDYNGKPYKCMDPVKDAKLMERVEKTFNNIAKELGKSPKKEVSLKNIKTKAILNKFLNREKNKAAEKGFVKA